MILCLPVFPLSLCYLFLDLLLCFFMQYFFFSKGAFEYGDFILLQMRFHS